MASTQQEMLPVRCLTGQQGLSTLQSPSAPRG